MSRVRYITTYYSNGTEISDFYTIRIYDSSLASDLNIRFECDQNGAEINWRSETKQIPIGIIPSSCKFTMLIQNEEQSYIINQFKNASRGKYTLEVEKNGVQFWVGIIRTDGIVQENISYPFAFQILAADSILDLQDVEVNHDSSLVNLSTATNIDLYIKLKDLLIHGINNLPYLSFLNASEVLRTRNEWYSDEHASTSNDPFDNLSLRYAHYYDLSSPFTEENDGWITKGYKLINIYDAINELCNEFNARFYQENGGFVFEQITSRINDSYSEWVYSSSGTLTTTNIDFLNEINITQTSDEAAILTGSSWMYLPPLKSVIISANLGQDYDLAATKHWGNTDTGIKTLNYVIINDNSYSTQLLVDVDIEFEITSPKPNNLKGVWIAFDIYLKIGAKYWKRDIVSRYLTYDPDTFTIHEFPQEWTGSSGINYEVAVDRFRTTEDGSNYYQNGTFRIKTLTPNLLEGGEPNMEVRFLGICENAEDLEFLIYRNPATYSIIWQTLYVGVSYTSNQDILKVKKEIKTEANNTTDNIDILEVKLNITGGGAVYSRNALYAWNGSNWIYADNWGFNTLSGTKTLHRLLASEMLAARRVSIRNLQGSVFSEIISYSNKVIYDNVKYISTSYNLNTGQSEVDGEWIELYKDITGISYPDDEEGHKLIDNGISKDGFNSVSQISGQDVSDGDQPLITDQIANLNESALTGIVTSITIYAASYNIAQSGDLLYIINKDTSIVDVLTVTDDVKKGDTSISVTGTLINVYNVNDYIYLQRPYNEGITHNESKLAHFSVADFKGTRITVTGITLHDPATTSDLLIHKRYRLWVGGTKRLYKGASGWTIDVSAGKNDIVLSLAVKHADIELLVYKINT